jgi:hypothetical protein
MTQPEGVLVNGEGWQEHTLRWGDYGNLAVDPVDGCTFWYSAVYMRADSNASTFNFTQEYSRIGSFRLPSCVTAAPNDFALVADPPTRVASAGATVSFAISSRVAAGQTEPLQLTVNPLPAGVKAQLAASTMQSDGATTLSITPDATVSGTAMITVHAAGTTASHDASVSLVVSTIPPSPAPPAPPNSGGTGPTSGGGCSSAPPDLWPILVLLAMTVRMRAAFEKKRRHARGPALRNNFCFVSYPLGIGEGGQCADLCASWGATRVFCSAD